MPVILHPATPASSDPINVKGQCHCGAVKFEATLCQGLASARRCSCSYCRARGAVAVSAKVGELRITEGEDQLSTYRFNTGIAEHHFCRNCGIYIHHKRRSSPDQYGVNVACIEGMSPFDFDEVPIHDGGDHPRDRADGKMQAFGVLKVVRS